MSQADGYVRIVTQNDTTEAERSTEQLGDTIRESLDTTPADKMTDAIDDVRNGIDATGEAAVNAGDLIKANLVSDIIMNGIQQLGSALKDAAVHTVEVADGLDNSVNRIAAATNASADEMIRLKSIVEQIYGDNFGDGFDDIAESVSKIKQNIDDLNDAASAVEEVQAEPVEEVEAEEVPITEEATVEPDTDAVTLTEEIPVSADESVIEEVKIPEETTVTEEIPVSADESVIEEVPAQEASSSMADMSNPNKIMTPDEIAALIANL